MNLAKSALKNNNRFTLGQLSKASSAISFKGITLSPRKPPSAVISIAHWASFIRAAKAEEENPAKTTECIAPIRAQAKTAIVNSGIIGM